MGELLGWLPEMGQLSLPPWPKPRVAARWKRWSDELMTDLLDKDDSWDWNAEFDGAVKQLRDDWRRRRQQELAARPLSSLSASERQELDRTGTVLACQKRQDKAPVYGIIAGF